MSFWIAVGDGNLYNVDATGTVLDTIPVPLGAPGGLAYDGLYLWYLDWEGGSIYAVNPTSGTVIDDVPVPAEAAYAEGLAHDGTFLYVADRKPNDGAGLYGMIYKLDSEGNVVDQRGPGLPGCTSEWHLRGLGWDGTNLIYSSRGTDRFYRLTADLASVDDFTATRYSPIESCFDGSHYWFVDSQDKKLWEIDDQGNQYFSVALPGVPAGGKGGIVFVDDATEPPPIPPPSNAFNFGIQYVHPAGSDSYDGFTTSTPKQTLEAAYGDLPNGGVIIVAKGRHDVGDGLGLVRDRPVVIQGVGRWRRFAPRNVNQYPYEDPCLFSSTGATRIINFDQPTGFKNGQGFEFSNLVFEMLDTCQYGIDAQAISYARVLNCSFWSKNLSAIGINADTPGDVLGDDTSWWRVADNISSGCQLIEAKGGQVNNWIVQNNILFSAGAPKGMVFDTLHRSTISGNNLEGDFTSGIQIGLSATGSVSYANLIQGNGGEDVEVLIDVVRGTGQVIIPLGVVNPTTDNTLVRFSSGSGHNIVLAPARRYPYDPSAYLDDQVVDGNGSNMIVTAEDTELALGL